VYQLRVIDIGAEACIESRSGSVEQAPGVSGLRHASGSPGVACGDLVGAAAGSTPPTPCDAIEPLGDQRPVALGLLDVAVQLGLLCSTDVCVNLLEHLSVSCFKVHRAVVRGDSMC
jgi:hypothetical protein